MAAHDTLRSHFPAVDGQPSLELWPASSFAVEAIDATGRSESEFQADLQQAVATPHNLERDRLVSLRAYRRPNNTTVLLVRAHHILLDGHAFGSMIREIFERYFGMHGEVKPDAAQTGDYFDFARAQRQRVEGETGEKDRQFWSQYLMDAPEPIGRSKLRPGKSNPRGIGAAVNRFIASEAELPVRSAARQMGVSLHSLMTAAGQVLLHSLTGGTDLLVTSSYANRESAAVERLIGWTNNVTMLRSDFDPAATFRDQATKVSAGWAEVLSHSSYPFHLMQEAAADTNGKQLPPGQFGVFMNWPDNMERAGFERIFLAPPGTQHRFGDIEVSLLPVMPPGAGHFVNDALVFYQEMEGSLLLRFQYGVHLFDADEAEAVVDRYLEILRRAIADPDSSLGDLAAPT